MNERTFDKPAAILDRSGQALVVAELGEEYRFTDVDGTQPRSVRAEFA
jgi:hypothetical protein